MYPSYRDIINRTNDPVALAFAKILRVAIMHRSTDMFGPIPFTKVLGDKTEGDGLSAPYDSQEEVYVAMFKELEEADEALKENLGLSAEGFKKLDNLYYGDVRNGINTFTRYSFACHAYRLCETGTGQGNSRESRSRRCDREQ